MISSTAPPADAAQDRWPSRQRRWNARAASMRDWRARFVTLPREEGATVNPMAAPRTRRARVARRRARRVAASGSDLTDAEWILIRDAWGRCAYCGRAGLALQKDCVLPISRGGRSTTWFRPAAAATRASATQKSRAGCVDGGSTSGRSSSPGLLFCASFASGTSRATLTPPLPEPVQHPLDPARQPARPVELGAEHREPEEHDQPARSRQGNGP